MQKHQEQMRLLCGKINGREWALEGVLQRTFAKEPRARALWEGAPAELRAYVRGLGTACVLPGVAVSETQTMRARAA